MIKPSILIACLILCSCGDPKRARYAETVVLVERVLSALVEYTKDCGRRPDSHEFPDILLSQHGECWKGPYVRVGTIMDGWGNTMKYEFFFDKFCVFSLGKDGMPSTKDDIKRCG